MFDPCWSSRFGRAGAPFADTVAAVASPTAMVRTSRCIMKVLLALPARSAPRRVAYFGNHEDKVSSSDCGHCLRQLKLRRKCRTIGKECRVFGILIGADQKAVTPVALDGRKIEV